MQQDHDHNCPIPLILFFGKLNPDIRYYNMIVRRERPAPRVAPSFMISNEEWYRGNGRFTTEYYHWRDPKDTKDPTTMEPVEFGSDEHIRIGVSLGFLESAESWVTESLTDSLDSEESEAFADLIARHDAAVKQYIAFVYAQCRLGWDEYMEHEGIKYGKPEFTFTIHNDPACGAKLGNPYSGGKRVEREDGTIGCTGCDFVGRDV